MDIALLVKAAAAFAFVLGLMFLLSWFLRRLGLAGPVALNSGPKRLGLVEHLMIDHRRRLVLVRRDGREHLLLLGVTGETVIEKDIDTVKDGDIVKDMQAGAKIHDAA